MADEVKDPFEGAGEYKFPDTPVPDDTVLFEPGQYIGIVGRIKPFLAGLDGRRAPDGDPNATLTNISQEIWVQTAMTGWKTNAQIFVPRIVVKDGIVTFTRNDSRGVKLFESFATPANRLFDKLSWRAKQFYHDFPGVIIGERGSKRVVWEVVKKYYGQVIMFLVEYNPSKKDRSKIYRNLSNVQLATDNRHDAEIMAKIETMYGQFRAKEQAETEKSKQKQPDSSVDDMPF